MSSILSSAGLICYILGLLAGLLLVPLGLPGTWLIVIVGIIYSLASGFHQGKSDFWILVPVVIMAILAEALEFGIGYFGSKKLNVSNQAIIASIVGGFVGAFIGTPIFLIGSLIGLLVGVFLGAFLYELLIQKDTKVALQSALGAFFSRVTAMVVKTVIAFVMVLYLFTKTF